MQCNDCHFAQDNHGNGKIYGEPRAAVEIDCIDCHGTIRKKATLITSGPAAPKGGRHLDALRTPGGLRRFEWRDGKLLQRSMSEENKEWEIVQTIDTITPGLVSSQNANRDWLYYTQQTVSAPGFSGQAFSTFVPHTVRAKETKQCSDCHVSANNDNNAWMAQLLLQGTNFMNFMGRYVYVATGKKGFEAIAVAEHDEPEAIYGSDLQRITYPGNYKNFLDHHRELSAAAEHPGNVLDIQARGEYAYAALGPGGLRVYDIANIDNKSFSEKVVAAPVSPIGQRFYVPTKNAIAVVSPTTLAVDPLRQQLPENEEQPIHLLYGYLYVADQEEGLVIIGDPNLKSKSPGVGTLLDGNPANNFRKRAVTFNPNGVLTGARRMAIAGTFAYVLTDNALVVVDLDTARPARHCQRRRTRSQRSSRDRRAIPLRLRRRS